jgi:MYXO-CTERM domain-containing protein
MKHLLRPALALGTLLWASQASAYCRTTTCDPRLSACPEVADNPGCFAGGVPLFWPVPCVGLALQQGASKQVSYEVFAATVEKSFAAWSSAACSGGKPSLAFSIIGPVPCGNREFNENKGNANILVFREDEWPYTDSSSVLALSTLTFGVDTGTILDADMEINAVPSLVTLTTTDSDVKIDLQSILTHEAGHFMGMAHSLVSGATMYPSYNSGQTSFRDLDADDVAGICAVYPPARAGLPACDVLAASKGSLGFSATCGGDGVTAPADDSSTSGCHCAAAGGGDRAPRLAALGVLAALGLALGRRRRR